MGTSIGEVIFKGAPESLLAVLCVYFFCKIRRPKTNEMFLLWAIIMVVTFVSRILMDGYGVSLLITTAVLVVIFHTIVKIPLTKVINGSLLFVLFLIIAEALNFLMLQLLIPDKLELILNDSHTRIIYTIPSTILLALQVFAVYYYYFIRKQKDV